MTLSRFMFALAESRLVRVVAVAAALAVVLGLGVLGLGHGGPGETNMDTRYLYLAGKYLLAGTNPYTPGVALPDVGIGRHEMQQYNFAYPPQMAPLCLLLALGSVAGAGAVMNLLNLAAIAVLAWVGVRTIEDAGWPRGAQASTAHRWFVPALIAGNLSTAFVVWMGQTTLIATAGLAAAWYFARRDRWVIAGIALAIATFKPPLSIFVVLWFVLTGQWRVLFAAAATVLVFSAVPMAIAGPVAVFFDWLHAVGRYADHPHNALGTRMLFNLRSFLHAVGIETPDLFAFGFLATLALWWWRRTFAERDILALLIGAGLLFGYGHSYDLAALAVLIPVFWLYVRPRASASLAALVLLLAISFPNSVLVRFGSDLLLHARVLLVCAVLLWLMALSAEGASAAAD